MSATALVGVARAPVEPAPELRQEVSKANRAWRRHDFEITAGREGLRRMKAWLEAHEPELARQEDELVTAIEHHFINSRSGALPEDAAYELRSETGHVGRVYALIRDYRQPARERRGMLLEAEVLEARAALLHDVVAIRQQRLAAMLVPVAALEGRAEIVQQGDTTTERLSNFTNELLVAAAELRARVRELDGLAAGGAKGASDYNPDLLQLFEHRMSSLFDVKTE